MVTRSQLRLAFNVLVVLVFTIEYACIAKMWRRPVVGYRLVLGTLVLLTISFEVDRVFGEGFFMHVPRTIVLAIATNFILFEEFMWLRRRAEARKRRVYAEEELTEDSLAAIV